ncbi:MAG: TIGR03936 family radical SAM-associated protein [Actinomycetota bacterium]|nr:TIGR03936 family radical SAM-associated protein [Actinomycetota bacterium]
MPSPPPAQPPVQQPPPVQRVRIRYTKRGRLRFTSHRDIGRAFERAVRRSGLPVAYSSGFNPHPRLSYAGAAPTGAASEAEYLEIALARRCSVETVREALDAAMPPGLDVVDAVTAQPRGESAGLSERLEASRWLVRLPGASPAATDRAVGALLASERVEVSRMTKRGLRTFDVRSALVSLAAAADTVTVVPADLPPGPSDGARGVTPAAPGAPCAILQMVVRHGQPSIRPDDVLAGLREVAGLETSSAPLVQRLEQGPLDPRNGTVGDPLAPDRDTPDA